MNVTHGDIFFIALVSAVIWGIMALVGRARKKRYSQPDGALDHGAADAQIASVLRECRIVAVVGSYADASDRSTEALRFLKAEGYTVFPVHVGAEERVGMFRSLTDLPQRPELVVLALDETHARRWAQEAVSARARALWLEKGTGSAEAMQAAREGGLAFIMDRAIDEEHRRLLCTG